MYIYIYLFIYIYICIYIYIYIYAYVYICTTADFASLFTNFEKSMKKHFPSYPHKPCATIDYDIFYDAILVSAIILDYYAYGCQKCC